MLTAIQLSGCLKQQESSPIRHSRNSSKFKITGLFLIQVNILVTVNADQLCFSTLYLFEMKS